MKYYSPLGEELKTYIQLKCKISRTNFQHIKQSFVSSFSIYMAVTLVWNIFDILL